MLKGFRDFIMRGNVVDLAIGFVVGAAFTTVVTDLTNDFINPLISLFGGGKKGGTVAGTFTVHGVLFNWGQFVSGVINFLLVSAVVYFLIVLPINRLNQRNLHFFKFGKSAGTEKAPEAPALAPDLELLTQIRDALLANQALLAEGVALAPAQRAAVEPADEGTASETA